MIQSPCLSGTAVTESLLVPVDTGNKQIKTPRHIFTAGLTCHDSYPPFGKDVIQYKGKYYTLSDQRVPYMWDKTADERYFILSLFGIACGMQGWIPRSASMSSSSWGCLPPTLAPRRSGTGAIFTNMARSTSGSTTGQLPCSSARCGSIPRHMQPLPR